MTVSEEVVPLFEQTLYPVSKVHLSYGEACHGFQRSLWLLCGKLKGMVSMDGSSIRVCPGASTKKIPA